MTALEQHDLLPTLPGCYVDWAEMPKAKGYLGGALFSQDMQFRYALARMLRPEVVEDRRGVLVVAMLNPSDATHVKDDPTVNRMRLASYALGYAALVVVNMFALRATNPKVLGTVADPVGPHNDAALAWAAGLAKRHGGTLVCGWGGNVAKPAWRMDRARAVTRSFLAHSPHAWALTNDGHPGHPLYLPGPLTPRPWVEAEVYGQVGP